MWCSQKSEIIKRAHTFRMLLVSKMLLDWTQTSAGMTVVLASRGNNDLMAWKSIIEQSVKNCFNLVVNTGWGVGKRPLCLSFCANSWVTIGVIGVEINIQGFALLSTRQYFVIRLSLLLFCCICLNTRQVGEGFFWSRDTVAAGLVLCATPVFKKRIVGNSVCWGGSEHQVLGSSHC